LYVNCVVIYKFVTKENTVYVFGGIGCFLRLVSWMWMGSLSDGYACMCFRIMGGLELMWLVFHVIMVSAVGGVLFGLRVVVVVCGLV